MALPVTQLKISAEEHRMRCEKLLMHLHANSLNGVVLFDRQYVLYYTGFAFIPTERPMMQLALGSGKRNTCALSTVNNSGLGPCCSCASVP